MQVLCGLSRLILLFLCMGSYVQAQTATSWRIHGLNLQGLTADGVSLSIEQLSYADTYQISDVTYNCAQVIGLYPVHQCEQAQLSFTLDGQRHQFISEVFYDLRSHDWSVALQDVSDRITMAMNSERQQLNVTLNQVPFTHLLNLIHLKPEGTVPDIELTGQLVVDLSDQTIRSTDQLLFSGLNYEYSDDIIVAELSGKLGLIIDFELSEIKAHIDLDAGEMLFEQLYVDFSGFPVAVQLEAIEQPTGGFQIQAELLNQQSLKVDAVLGVNDDFEIQHPKFTIDVIDSHHFNQRILNSVLGIYGMGGSEMSGQFTVGANSADSSLDQWQIHFNDFYFLNERRKIEAQSLDGQILWQQKDQAPDSDLNWDSLLLAGLPVGQSSAFFNFSGDEIRLIGGHQFPVFDGTIELKAFEVQKLFSEFVDMQVDANVLPISLRLITEKMGWPSMSGTISGDLPGLVKQGAVIKFLGGLELQVFGGDMTVDNLSIERLFGVAPVIAGDVVFNGFDLAVLTETFGFGLITGKLDGRVDELRITNWKTDRLDAQVYTVKTKGVKQIISQRAIENISSLGGIKGAISNTFLRFFDDFRYKKIKLSCKLHNSVCEIGGLKNQNNQFVIVEGGGIPKINIVGFVRSINWEEFISRLLNANYNN